MTDKERQQKASSEVERLIKSLLAYANKIDPIFIHISLIKPSMEGIPSFIVFSTRAYNSSSVFSIIDCKFDLVTEKMEYKYIYWPNKQNTPIRPSENTINSGGYENVHNEFEAWAALALEYRNSFVIEVNLIQKYEEEFYQILKVDSVDFFTTPFSLQQQLFILKFLNFVNSVLRGWFIETKVNSETEKLQSTLSMLTKDQTIRFLSNILTRIRRMSLRLFADILNFENRLMLTKVIKGEASNNDSEMFEFGFRPTSFRPLKYGTIPSEVYIFLPQEYVSVIDGEEITNACGNFMEAMGFTLETLDEPIYMSFWTRLKFVFKKHVSAEEVDEIFTKGKRALELKHLDIPTAEQTEKLASAAEKLVNSLDKFEEGVVRCGALLVLKKKTGNGTQMFITQLNFDLIKLFDDKPQLLTNLQTTYELVTGDVSKHKLDDDGTEPAMIDG